MTIGLFIAVIFAVCFVATVFACGLAAMAGRTTRQDEHRARFTRYDHEQRGWFA